MQTLSTFKKALDTFLRGESSTLHLQQALEDCLASKGCRIDLIHRLLDKAREAGMGTHIELDLRNRITRPCGDTGTGERWSTNADSAEEQAGDIVFKPGTVLKDRFELLEALGEGGMGMVFKAVDRLKLGARDDNPYLAIKLLTVDLQSHPQAFTSLQREFAKVRQLVHPNIAAVYDSDRDQGTVYMTMELLEGCPLDYFIRRKIPAGGLAEAKAIGLIRQLCAGLSHAHQANLVHSDLKPGNCWLSDDGSLKLLDFGVARAYKPVPDVGDETTVHDSDQLGALTPAYASVEMLEAQVPDPRDDIYALGCIAYELFTGKHPFHKIPAPRAMLRGLAPPNIDKLSRRQNQGLLHALAFRREDRTPSVKQFLEEITKRNTSPPKCVAAALGLVLLLDVAAVPPVTACCQGQTNQAIVAYVPESVLHALNPGDRSAAFADSLAMRDGSMAKSLPGAADPIACLR